MHDIIVIGSSTRDVFLSSDELKVIKSEEFTVGQGLCAGFGSKVEVQKIVFSTGGGATNAAVTFARQGLNTACVSVVGKDFNGQEVLRELKSEGVDTKYCAEHEDDFTGYSTILVGRDGERTILSYKGEGQHFDIARIPFEDFSSKWMYISSLGGHLDVLEACVKWATTKEVKLAINPGGKDLTHGLKKLQPLLKYFSVVMMNQEEAAQLTGISFDDEKKLFAFMDDIIGGVFVMTKGRDGVVVSDGKHIYRSGIPDSPVVERTGAGDAFNSAFVAEYIRSGDITKAIQLGTANASSVVAQYGPKAGILKKGDNGAWPAVDVKIG